MLASKNVYIVGFGEVYDYCALGTTGLVSGRRYHGAYTSSFSVKTLSKTNITMEATI